MQAGYRCQVEVWGTGPDAEAYALIRSVDFFFSFQIDVITGDVTVNDFNLYNIGLIIDTFVLFNLIKIDLRFCLGPQANRRRDQRVGSIRLGF